MAIQKVVKSQTPPEQLTHQVRFDPTFFNGLIYDKGYAIYHDKALKCPCSVKSAGQPMPNCNNCLGVGWFFVDRTETRIAVQGMKADVRFENWTRDTAGMAKITSRAIDKLSFMDRLILKDVEGYYNEILRSRVQGDRKVIFSIYEIIDVESLFLFADAKSPLVRLQEDVDYVVDKDLRTMITLSALLSSQLSTESTLSIRYRHYQTYHMIDMNRDIVKVRTKEMNEPDEKLKEMPIMGMARKAHYLFDNVKYDESQRLIENS